MASYHSLPSVHCIPPRYQKAAALEMHRVSRGRPGCLPGCSAKEPLRALGWCHILTPLLLVATSRGTEGRFLT